MTGIRLYTSNQLEVLAESLAGVLSTPLKSPLAEEIIVVQSAGMERWLSMHLAEYHGICANYRFPFPNAFIYEIFRKFDANLPERSPFDPPIMTWIVMGLLPALAGRPGFESLRNYLVNDPDGLKCFQLAERIANLFDQYLLFRPEMILKWEQGEEDHWQAQLWRALTEDWGGRHRPALAKSILDVLQSSPGELSGLPERISVFGISALPRFHLQMIAGIAKVTQINLFLMNPCREYWGDIASERQIRKALAQQGVLPEEVYLHSGNSLLASMGALGRDFWEIINEFECRETTSFRQPPENNLLSCIQADILNLRERDPQPERRTSIHPADDSIQIHSCHSPMREMEVLYDRLLDMFEQDGDLKPGDILVMMPDVEAYAPFIEAVFDTPADDAKRIPFSIADQSMRRESQVIASFLGVLDLWGGRFRSSEVLAVLESKAVQARFDLAEADLDPIRKWVQDARIRWGIDQRNREELGLPAFAENTWKAGIERLLLGYAMPRQGHETFHGTLPYDLIEGADALLLGKFLEFTARLFHYVTRLEQPRTLKEWAASLAEMVDGLFKADEAAQNELQAIRRALREMAELAELARFAAPVGVKVVRSYLGRRLERQGFGFGFITGGVTFCAMLPMRSIPRKVICLVGMDNDAYPRQSKAMGFDLMAGHPQRGDPSRRNDDRYLFLEAILSARERLYISYVGQSIQDNSAIPPSVLVSELQDYIERGFTVSAGGVCDRLVTQHRLQAFSPEYFKDPRGRLFSYSQENCRAARQMANERRVPADFVSSALSSPEEECRTLDLSDLCAFFRNPARFLLNRRLGVYFDQAATVPEQTELFEIKQLSRYELTNDLLKLQLDGHDLGRLFAAKRAEGLLPHGTPGECSYKILARGVESFVAKTEPYLQSPRSEPLAVDLQIGDFRLTGGIAAIYSGSLVHFRYAKLQPFDRLLLWIHHLALCVAAPKTERHSMVIGLSPDSRNEWTSLQYSFADSAAGILEDLLGIYWQGLVAPAHFFPRSSWCYASELLQNKKAFDEALTKAAREWNGSDYFRGESLDPYYDLCFRHADPFDRQFQELAEKVFAPLFNHQCDTGV